MGSSIDPSPGPRAVGVSVVGLEGSVPRHLEAVWNRHRVVSGLVGGVVVGGNQVRAPSGSESTKVEPSSRRFRRVQPVTGHLREVSASRGTPRRSRSSGRRDRRLKGHDDLIVDPRPLGHLAVDLHRVDDEGHQVEIELAQVVRCGGGDPGLTDDVGPGGVIGQGDGVVLDVIAAVSDLGVVRVARPGRHQVSPETAAVPPPESSPLPRQAATGRSGRRQAIRPATDRRTRVLFVMPPTTFPSRSAQSNMAGAVLPRARLPTA